MYRIFSKATFVKHARRLSRDHYELLKKKIALLKYKANHSSLKVHKLHGEFNEGHSFSLDYGLRVIFKFESKREISLLAVGNHDIYK